MNESITAVESGGVLRVTLRRPEKRNALSRALLAGIGRTFAEWAGREDLVVATLTGEGDKAFASGGDVHELSAMREQDAALEFAEQTRAALDAVRKFPVPVVAALNGDALGGGAELALACDIRIAAAHARVGFLQGRLNISTAWGGGLDLFRLVGPSRALSLLGCAEPVGAARALELGLVDEVAPAEAGLEATLEAFVAKLAARPPQVMRAFKALAIADRFGATRDEAARAEARAFAETWVHPDHWRAAERAFSRAGQRA